MVLGGGQGGLSESAIPGAHRAGPRAGGRASGMGPAGGRRTRGRWVGRRVGRRAGGAYEASSRSSIMAMILSSPNERDEGVSGGDSVRRREGTQSQGPPRFSASLREPPRAATAPPRRRHVAAKSTPRVATVVVVARLAAALVVTYMDTRLQAFSRRVKESIDALSGAPRAH
jgi:hypothetical protein